MSLRFASCAFPRTFALLSAFLLLTSAAFAQQLTPAQLPDKSGTVGVAPGWKLAGGSNGAADLIGPNGATMTLGMPLNVVTQGVERLFPDVPGPLFPGSLRVDFNDPVRAFLDIVRVAGPKAGIRINQLRAVENVPWEKGRAAYIRASVTIKGVRTEVFGLYAIMPIDNVQALFYYSSISTPTRDFERQYPAMMAMWNSWSVNPETLKKRLTDAAKALAEVDFVGTVDSVVRERRAAGERAARKWDRYIRQ